MQPITDQPYYTMPELLMLIAAIGTLLTGLIAGIANAMISVRTSTSIKQHVKENTDITHATLTTTKVIEAHVNSERTKLDEQLASKDRENETLKRELAERNQATTILASRVPDPNAAHDRRANDRAKG